MFLMRWILRIAVVALAGYGAKALYDNVIVPAREPSRAFTDHAKDSLSTAAERVSNAAHDLNRDVSGAAHEALNGAAVNIDRGTQPQAAE